MLVFLCLEFEATAFFQEINCELLSFLLRASLGYDAVALQCTESSLLHCRLAAAIVAPIFGVVEVSFRRSWRAHAPPHREFLKNSCLERRGRNHHEPVLAKSNRGCHQGPLRRTVAMGTLAGARLARYSTALPPLYRGAVLDHDQHGHDDCRHRIPIQRCTEPASR